jgi:hypothetical protein
MPPKKITALGAALQPLDTNQETLSLSLSERPEAKRESYHSNTSGGGVGPGDQEHGDHSPTSAKEEGEDGSVD